MKEKYLSIAVGTAVGAGIALFAYNKYVKKYEPRKVGVVTGLAVHPFKSGRGMKVDTAFASNKGLVHDGLLDRSWCVKYEHNKLKVSAREEPTLLKITVKKISDDEVTFNAEGYPSLSVSTHPNPDNKRTIVHVFGIDIEAEDIGDKAADWISGYLGKRCRMTFNPVGRSLRQSIKFRRNWRLDQNPRKDTDTAAFQDGYPYLLMAEDSLRDINEHLPWRHYTMETFRQNIIVKSLDNQPFAEDNWKGLLQMGEAIIAVAAPNPRCVITSYDPDTLEKDRPGEPLNALKTWRQAKGYDKMHVDQYKDKGMAGMHAVIIQEGQISVGDDIILTPY